MWFQSLYRSWMQSRMPVRSKPLSGRPRRQAGWARPRFEPLESRLLLSAGSLDPTFGSVGAVTGGFPEEGAQAVAVQPDGKVVVVGQVSGLNLNFAVARYNADGTPDTTFGPAGDGKVMTDFHDDDDVANAIALQDDGKIVVVGTAYHDGNPDFAIARYLPDGQLDVGFGGGDGKVTTGFGGVDKATAVAIQADGKLVVVGYSHTVDILFGGNTDFAIARYNADGSLDHSFGERISDFSTYRTGKRSTGFGGDEQAYSVAIDYSGTPATNPHYGAIVVAGEKDSAKFVLARYTKHGDLDGSFDDDGKVGTSFPGYDWAVAHSVVIQSDGKIVAAGEARTGWDPIAYPADFALVRYNPNGSRDVNFGTDGTGRVISDLGGDNVAYSIVIGHGGNLLTAGGALAHSIVARYTPEGVLDTSFSGDGLLRIDYASSSFDETHGLALAPGGTIVAAGRHVGYSGGDSNPLAMARFFDYVPTVNIFALDPFASEIGPDTATLVVTRDNRESFPTRIYYSADGTADRDADYARVPSSATTAGRAYVDIPAYETLAIITITPVNDHIAEGIETARLVLGYAPSYDLDAFTSATILISEEPAPIVGQQLTSDLMHVVASTPTETQKKRVHPLTGASKNNLDRIFAELADSSAITTPVAMDAVFAWLIGTVGPSRRLALQWAGIVLMRLDPNQPPHYPYDFWTNEFALMDDIAAAVRVMADPADRPDLYRPMLENIMNLATLTNTYFDIGQTQNPALDAFVRDWVKVMQLAGCSL